MKMGRRRRILTQLSRNPRLSTTVMKLLPITRSHFFKIQETVVLPDQVLIFLNYHSASPLLTKNDLHCTYFPPNSSKSQLKLPPLWIDTQNSGNQIIRCPIVPRRFTTSISLKFRTNPPQVSTPYHWDSSVYEAVVDRDNSSIVFVKGLKLRPGRLADASRYECVYGWDFKKPRFLLTAEVPSAEQEAGFSHCFLRARETCEWVGFIDVDEFLHFPLGMSLHDMIQNRTLGVDRIGELCISCHNFRPSGLRKIPAQGVSVGYTCRLAIPKMHKSIVRPEVLNILEATFKVSPALRASLYSQ